MTVTAFFSAGPDAVTIQDLKGKTQEEARQYLSDAGLNVGDVNTEDSPDVPKGAVTKTDPAPASPCRRARRSTCSCRAASSRCRT